MSEVATAVDAGSSTCQSLRKARLCLGKQTCPADLTKLTGSKEESYLTRQRFEAALHSSCFYMKQQPGTTCHRHIYNNMRQVKAWSASISYTQGSNRVQYIACSDQPRSL